MEEILASIRRIIADDQRLASNVAASVAGEGAYASAAEAVAVEDESSKPAGDAPVAGSAQEAGTGTGGGFSPTDQPASRAQSEQLHSEHLQSVPLQSELLQSDLARDLKRLSSGHIAEEPPQPGGLADARTPEAAQPESVPQPAETERAGGPAGEAQAAAEPDHGSSNPAQSPHATSQKAAGRLISPTTDASVASAFDALSTTVLSSPPRTLEDLVGDLLRPMLQAWLDANLPEMVERLVRAEIERITRGKRI